MQFLNLLEQWGLSKFTQNFIDEGITDDSFSLLDEQTIQELFDKAGPRLIFKQKYNEYLSRVEHNETTDEKSNHDETHDLQSINIPGPSGYSSTSVETSSVSDIYLFEPDKELLKILEEPDKPQAKKIRRSSIFSTNGLEELLMKSTDGKVILMNRHKLNNDMRQKLSKLVINDLFSREGCTEIKRETFMKAAEEIINLFPGEHRETYYIPYCSAKTGLRMPARGKLWSKYVNIKAALRIANQSLLSRELKSSNKENNAINSTLENSEEIETELNFLKTGIEPKTRVISAWETTFERRYQLYFNDNKTDNLYEIFPSLKSDFALELLEIDFNHIYPEKIDIIYQTWPKVIDAIFSEAKDRKIELPDVADKSTQAILILPFLFNPVTLRKNSKDPHKNWRPTRTEIQHSFVFQVQDAQEQLQITNRRKALLDKYNFPLQPFGVISGTDYIIISNEVTYKCTSCIRMIELLFKTIHALNLEYPCESKHIWNFIQELVFLMNVTNKSSSTSAVISDIKFHFKD